MLQDTEAVGERLVDEVIELSHLNPHQRFLMLLFFSDCGLHLLLLRRQLAIEHAKVDAVRLFGQFPRFFHIV